MLSQEHRLRRAKDFFLLSVQGRSIHGPYLTLRIRQVKQEEKKIGFITSTKVFKRAVDRNRIKRRLRAMVSDVRAELPEKFHLLFVVKPDALEASTEALIEEIRRMVAKIPEAMMKPPKLSPGAVRRGKKRKVT